MATYNDVKKALEAIPDVGAGLVAALEAHITAEVSKETEKGKELKRKSDNEAIGIRGRFKKLASHLELDIENDTPEEFEAKAEAAIAKLKAPKPGSSPDFKSSAEYLEMKSENEKTKKELSGLLGQLKQEKEKKNQSLSRDALRNALKAAKVRDEHIGDHVELLLKSGAVKVNDEEKVIAIGDGNEPMALDAFASKYVEKKDYLLENSQGPGGGGGSGNGGQGGGPAKTTSSTLDRLNRVRSIASDEHN